VLDHVQGNPFDTFWRGGQDIGRGVLPLDLGQFLLALIREEALVYYRDIQDHIIQAVDTIEAFRDTVSGMLDIYLSSLSHHLNEVMKVLTIIATIFMPLTFIAGIYGMNFNIQSSRFNMPELNWPFGYLSALSLMAIVAFGMVMYFKNKKWF